MISEINKEIKEIINHKDTVKVLVTLNEDGLPHAVVKQSIRFSDEGKIVYLELLESSKSYKNFTRSLWFNQKVVISISGKNGKSYQIKGTPEKILISGPIFEKYYINVREQLGDVDLAAVCIIDPEELKDESYAARFSEQESRQPIFKHLDRLARYYVS
ncbi:MAG TPA: pyridoxamine 5'-phosphate oxidase family protein [Pseudobacteroides sp.]|nr:pyridoxamine 5'-phosphate oxidase family protein [Pseudobacteroides sp.]